MTGAAILPEAARRAAHPSRVHGCCVECGTVLTARVQGGEFCGDPCRHRWHNRRKSRGAELYDLYMALRFERGVAKALGVFKMVNRLASIWRTEDKRERGGRRSWTPPAVVAERSPHLRATILQRGGAVMTRRDRIRNKVMARVVVTAGSLHTPCLIWTGPTSGENGRGKGYPRMSLDGATVAVHIVMFVLAHGPVPPRKQIDHRCRTRLCVNPDHLEMVTHRVNQKRRDLARMTCEAVL